MQLMMQPTPLSSNEIQRIHNTALSILADTGIKIGHKKIVNALVDIGGVADPISNRVTFSKKTMERFLDESDHVDPPTRASLSSVVNIYQGMYLDPESKEYKNPADLELRSYVHLAKSLDNIDYIGIESYPPAVGQASEPLEVHLFAWKYGIHETGAIQNTELCPYLFEMYEARAAETAKPLKEIFKGYVCFVEPLTLASHQAEQLLFFCDRGLHVSLVSMIKSGANAPITIAGSLALNLADRWAIGMIERALYHSRSWHLGSSIGPFDLRTMISPYGRPEMLVSGLCSLQLARHYRVAGSAHGGLSDAKVPGYESAAQKVMTALPCALAGSGVIESGLLSIDELLSPIQMILDNELVGALRHAFKQYNIDDQTLTLDTIDRVSKGGSYTSDEHTAINFSTEQWFPKIWSGNMLQSWLDSRRKNDIDNAMDIWHEAMAKPQEAPAISENFERQCRKIIDRFNASHKL